MIRSLRVSIPQHFFGDFFDSIDPKQTWHYAGGRPRRQEVGKRLTCVSLQPRGSLTARGASLRAGCDRFTAGGEASPSAT